LLFIIVIVAAGRGGAFWFGCGRVGLLRCGRDLVLRSRREQLADLSELCRTITIGKEAVMADALEAVGQNVEQEAADELGGCKRHELDARAVAVVLPTEGNMIIRDLEETMIGDGDAVRIAAQIAQNLLRPGKGLLAIDHPVQLPDRRKVGRKSSRLCQMREIGEELQAAVLVSGNKFARKHAPEQG